MLFDPPHGSFATGRAAGRNIELLEEGFFSPDERGLYHDVTEYLRRRDPFLVCADFADYVACQERAAAAYADSDRWSTMSVLNIAKSGSFSSDRTIREYARDIWGVEPVTIEPDPTDAAE